jgi:hypothetical protein
LSAKKVLCPNCGATAKGRFCAQCGQDNRLERLKTREVLFEAVQNFVNWDSTLMRTLRGLACAPGQLALEYVRGKRKSYVAPARLCLITLALWLVATRWLGIDPLATSGLELKTAGDTEPNALRAATEVREVLTRHLDLLLYVSLPLRAIVLKQFFRRTAFNVAECFVLVLYIASFGFLTSLVLAPLMAWTPGVGMALRQAITFVWSVWAARGFFHVGWWPALWRMALATLLHMIGTGLIMLAVALPFVL